MALLGLRFRLICRGSAIGASGVTLTLLLILTGCERAEDPTATPTAVPTATPTAAPTTTPTAAPTAATLEGVSLRQLYEEATVNLARYDHLYKGKWYLVRRTVDYMFDYQVVVKVPYGLYGDVRAVLTDLPHSDQIPLDSGSVIVARCQIGEVIGYGVHMENCSLE